MQQLQSTITESTTPEQSEQTAQTFSVAPHEIITSSQAAETSVVQQEQAEAVVKLLAALERDTRKRHKWNERLSLLMGLFVTSMFIIALVSWRVTGHMGEVWHYFQMVNFVNLLGFALGKLFLDKNAALELTKVEDVRCVGALVDVWGAQGNINYSKQVREQARAALTRLLPRLQAADATRLKEPQRAILRGVLAKTDYSNSWKDAKDAEVDFTCAILKAFESVGDWKSAPEVKLLAGPAYTKRIRDAAQECLPYLEALATKQKPGETLLRASSASEATQVSSETLLRPAALQQEVAPDTLVRPSGETPC